MPSEFLSLEIKEKLAVITIRRPEKKNAINQDMYDSLAEILNELSNNDDVSITVLTGSGDYYSSGNDLAAAFARAQNVERAVSESLSRVRKLVEAFITHKKVLVALVNGPAIGIAATTLPLCDIVYCTPEAWFLTPFAQLGICAEGCSSYTFPKILGNSKAGDMLYFNKKLSSCEAAATGFVARVIPRDSLEKEFWEVIKNNAATLSQKSLLATKKLMRRFDELQLHEANRIECEELNYLFHSEEAMAALIRFSSRKSQL